MSNPYGQQPGYPQQGGWSQPAQPGGYPPQQPGGWSQPGQPGGWSQPAQPGYPSSQPGGYPPQQPGGFPPQQPGGWPQQQGFAPGPQTQKKSSGLIILVVVLVVLVGGGAAGWFLFLSPSHSNSPLFNRHGVPANVPLPNGLTYDSQTTASQSDSGITLSITEWGWQVSGSNPAAVQKFYTDNLPGKGWTNVKAQTGSSGDQQVSACQGSNVLSVDIADKVELTDANGKTTSTVTAPSGGAALGIAIITSNNSQALALFCSGQAAPGA